MPCFSDGGIMIKNANIPVAAKNFIERFGEDAPAEAKRRAQEMHIFGKANGYATWMLIYEEVKALLEGSNGNTRH